ncbi:MAG: hypothetical protein K9H64_21105 [Bacteroidales bacterium]|nr:hypothetical protein [Bacteroidales bacterium]MCF8458525.1 hypothetical protein [Bacteroidales bacterium]
MQIANPIYDVVFKYLMDDNRIARMLISKIIGDEIESLSFQPLENKVDLERQTITIYRLDFAARIKTDKGESKNVIIEIQKAKFPTDIMRFRKYLGQQYINDRNAEIIDERKVAIPIISIYFLGHGLDHTEAPVIKVNRNYIDVSTGDEIQEKEAFIESLTHDSYVIQIPHLKNRRRNDLEILLSVFDQSNIDKDHHIMNINEDNFPEKYRPIIRRLQRAIAEPQVRKTMDIEDEVLEELENKERAIFMRDEIIKQKDKKLEEKNKKLEEKDRIIEDLQKRLKGK